MNIKRLFALMMLVCMLFTVIPVMAAEENLLKNGDFSEATEEKINGWAKQATVVYGQHMAIEEFRGNKYIAFMPDEEVRFPYLSQAILPANSGNYTLKFKFMCSEPKAPRITIEYRVDGEYNALSFTNKELADGQPKVWKDYEIKFTLPKSAKLQSANLLIRGSVSQAGISYYDDVNLIYDADNEVEVFDKIIYEKPEPVEGAQNLIKTGDFDNGTEGWAFYKGALENNDFISIDEGLDGTKGIKIETSTGGNPWIRYMVPVEEFATYSSSIWMKPNYGKAEKGFLYKYEFYIGNEVKAGTGVADATSQYFQYANDNEWVEVSDTFLVPKGAKYVAIYFRLFTNGSVVLDNAEVIKVKNAPKVSMETDDIFYWTDFKTGTVTATLMEDGAADTAEFTLPGGEKKTVSFVNGKATAKFDLSLMEKEKAYKVIGNFKKGDIIVGNEEINVYCYDRPTAIREDGTYIMDGEPFVPVIAYHINRDKDYERVKELGINVVQAKTTTSIEDMQKTFDEAEKHGYKVLLTLYQNMIMAGNELRADITREAVQRFKDHPALFAYGVMDEPFSTNETDNSKEWLEESYKIVRGIDKVHPVYICQCPSYFEHSESDYWYNIARKYSDCLSQDTYPAGVYPDSTFVYDELMNARGESVGNKKPMYTILMAFTWKGHTPSPMALKSGIYQSLFAGAKGIGYYAFDEKEMADNTTEYWKIVKDYNENEKEDAENAFIHGKYPTVYESLTQDYHFRSFLKGDKLLVYVLNRSDEKEVDMQIPLQTFTGEAVTTSEYGSALPVKVEKAGVAIYELTLTQTPKTLETAFLDMASYPWARAQAEAMYKAGNIGDKGLNRYEPAKNITRGDFAKYLITTLGLTANATDNFADIPDDADYKDAVAIGRALGILKGRDGVNYCPEDSISRQELMVICARGMRLAGTLADGAVGEFSDSSLIAEYAIKDIGAIVEAGIIKGNADGTINPLGNTTRAEAAVIMDRIFTWKTK